MDSVGDGWVPAEANSLQLLLHYVSFFAHFWPKLQVVLDRAQPLSPAQQSRLRSMGEDVEAGTLLTEQEFVLGYVAVVSHGRTRCGCNSAC